MLFLPAQTHTLQHQLHQIFMTGNKCKLRFSSIKSDKPPFSPYLSDLITNPSNSIILSIIWQIQMLCHMPHLPKSIIISLSSTSSGRSLVYKKKRLGLKIEPWGTQALIAQSEVSHLRQSWYLLILRMKLDEATC